MATVPCTGCGAALPATTEEHVSCPECGHRIDVVRAAHTSHHREEARPAVVMPEHAELPGFHQQATRQNGLIIAGYVFAGLGAILVPLIAVAAIVLGAIARGRGDERGRFVVIAGFAGLVVGLAMSYLFLTTQ